MGSIEYPKFTCTLYHLDTDEAVDVTVEGMWEKADPSVGLEHGYLCDITITSSDDEELDIDEYYGGEDLIQTMTIEYRDEQL